MKMNDQKEIAADPATVYAALLSPEVLVQCVPGAKEVTGTVEEGYTATVTQKVGPVQATFKGRVEMSDLVEGQKLTLTGEGKGGAAGFAKGLAVVTLAPSETGTLLSYDVEAKVGGKLAQLGSRLIDGFAKKMADQFFVNLQEALEPEETAEPGDAEEVEGTSAVPQDEVPKKGWFKRIFN